MNIIRSSVGLAEPTLFTLKAAQNIPFILYEGTVGRQKIATISFFFM